MNRNIEDVFKQQKRRKNSLKKTAKKISKILLIILLIVITDVSLILNCVQASNTITEKVYQIDYCDKVIKYQGILRGSTYIVYEEDGKEYPAYCINPGKDGVGEAGSYNVNVNGYITDITLWRIITNGYPYKTLEELGVANQKEAYLATKQAIYCYLDNRNVDEFSGIGEAGERTVKAIKQIWNSAINSNEIIISNILNIKPIKEEWSQDELNNNYISKTYKIETPAPITDYTVEIIGENLPEELIVGTTTNNAQKTFKENEEFKILIPIKSLKNDGNFEIKVKTKMETKPVLLGVSEDENLQSYALTTSSYEDSESLYYEKYPKNEAQIKIQKQEKGTNIPLEGVEFQLLNAEKKVILQNLLTDKNGEIIIKNIEPGTYYLKEVKTLEGYVLHNEDVEININLNEQVDILVENLKEIIIEKVNEPNIPKLPKTGM